MARGAGKSFPAARPAKTVCAQEYRLLDVCLNRRTLADMKGHFATLFGVSALISVATIASAHPGHSPTDMAAQLSAPAAGTDHLMIFGALSVIAVLVATRVALHFLERRKRQTSASPRR